MDQSLSITLVLEGGLPNIYLSVQDNYNSPAQVFNAPLELLEVERLLKSAQTPNDYWIVTTSPDNPRFQVESAISVHHRDGKIVWDLVYEHYEPFLNIELEDMADSLEENLISFVFDPFQYVSALYQAAKLCTQLQPTTFSLPKQETDDYPKDHPLFNLQAHLPRLRLIWQKYGQANQMVEHGLPTQQSDYFAHEAETQWLQELLETLESSRYDQMMDNIDAYLDALPDEVISQMEQNSKQLEASLLQRWEMLVESLTEEEAEALENAQSSHRFPNSLKLRLMREFLEGNPTVLLGNARRHEAEPVEENVIDLQHWKHQHDKGDQNSSS